MRNHILMFEAVLVLNQFSKIRNGRCIAFGRDYLVF